MIGLRERTALAPGPRPTRRTFLVGLGAGAAAPYLPAGLLAVESSAATPKSCTPNAPGARAVALSAARGGSEVWRTESAGRAITALRARTLDPVRSIDVGGAPVAIDVARGGRRAAVVTAAYDRPALALVDLRAGRTHTRVNVGREPVAVAVDRTGDHAVVVGGGAAGTLTPVDLRTGRVGTAVALGRHPRAVALAADGEHAYVTLNGDGQVCVVALLVGQVVQRFPTVPFPSRIAIAPDGHSALVTHDGAGAREITPIDLVHRRVGRPVNVGLDPCGVAYDRRGTIAAVAVSGTTGAVVLIDGSTGRRRRRVVVPGRPRSVTYAGGAFVAADWETGALTRVAKRRAS